MSGGTGELFEIKREEEEWRFRRVNKLEEWGENEEEVRAERGECMQRTLSSGLEQGNLKLQL